jgi:2-octaprenyl-6-methoxyphenol hydroxylase
MTQDNQTLEKQMEKFIGGSLGDIKIITKPISYPLSAFVCDKYFDGRLVLIADSAHGMHPLAGQALNMGIKDISYLVDIIGKYKNLGLKPDYTMLMKYQKARTLDNIAMVKITDTINSIFNTQIKPINKITELGLSLVNSMPILKDKLVDYAKGAR